MNSMDEIKAAMSALYEEVRCGKTDLRTASELANIAGKYLKAEQLQLAREVFLHNVTSPPLSGPAPQIPLEGG